MNLMTLLPGDSSPAVGPTVGLQFPADAAPSDVAGFAAAAEARGYASVWVVEDCFLSGSIALAAVALQATSRLKVGIGLMPAVMRNPAIAAMEIATLAGMFPDRLSVAFGHGVEAWMMQIGARPADRVVALEETVSAIRELLAGNTVTRQGRHVHLDGVALDRPPRTPVPILIGTTGARTLAAATRCADGVLLPEGAGPAFVGAVSRGRGPGSHSVPTVAYAWLSLDPHGESAVARLRPVVAGWLQAGLYPALVQAAAEVAGEADPDRDAFVREVAVCGTAEECEHAIRALHAAGAAEIVLAVPAPDRDEQVARFAREILPRL